MVPIVRPALVALALALAAAPATAQGVFVEPNIAIGPREPVSLTGAQRTARMNLERYGLRDVDVRRLSSGQLAQINHHVSRDRPSGEIRNQLETVVSGRGLGQRLLDRVTR